MFSARAWCGTRRGAASTGLLPKETAIAVPANQSHPWWALRIPHRFRYIEAHQPIVLAEAAAPSTAPLSSGTPAPHQTRTIEVPNRQSERAIAQGWCGCHRALDGLISSSATAGKLSMTSTRRRLERMVTLRMPIAFLSSGSMLTAIAAPAALRSARGDNEGRRIDVQEIAILPGHTYPLSASPKPAGRLPAQGIGRSRDLPETRTIGGSSLIGTSGAPAWSPRPRAEAQRLAAELSLQSGHYSPRNAKTLISICLSPRNRLHNATASLVFNRRNTSEQCCR
jgi:hypothetical protein